MISPRLIVVLPLSLALSISRSLPLIRLLGSFNLQSTRRLIPR
jgi:hypothetical protein